MNKISDFATDSVHYTVYRQKTLNDPSKQKANKLNSEHYCSGRLRAVVYRGLTHVKITLVME